MARQTEQTHPRKSCVIHNHDFTYNSSQQSFSHLLDRILIFLLFILLAKVNDKTAFY